jgi:hypothetical protein
MKHFLIPLLLTSACSLYAQPAMKEELADRITDDLLSMWSEADIPSKYSFLVWPAYREISRESNWPRLELVRDVSTVGDLVEVWPSRQALAQAVSQNLPDRALKEYVDTIRAASR